MARFYLLDFEEAMAKGLVWEEERSSLEHSTFVVEETTSGLWEVGHDGGEPEDQTLYRDWSWVVPALNKAFKDGKEAA